MSNYLQGSSDYVPAFQPFQVDLNYYSDVLGAKQHSYNEGLSKVNSIYGSVLNSSMSRMDNIQRRDKYFKTIEGDLKKVAGMDLSVDQNVDQAKQIFQPILNDKYIIKDISYTKGIQNSFQTAEQFRNCIDPEKCGGSYWDEGVQALQYAQEEFQKASPNDSLRYQPPSFTPFQNVTKKAIKAAKDSGFNVSYDHNDGRYLVTDTNGQLLLGQDGKGILPQYLYGMFGNDSSVQKMYATQAYVQRKNYAKLNAARFEGNEDLAESEYLNTIVQRAIPKLEASQRDLSGIRDRAATDTKALEVLARTNGGTIEGDGVQDQWGKLQDLLTKTVPAEDYHQQVANLINTAPHLNDIKSLRNRVDNIVANANFMNTIDAAAYDYAMGTSKREMKADPYALASYNNSLDISKGIALQNHEFGIWNEKEKIKAANDLAKIKGSLGISASDARDMNQFLVDKGITPEKLKQENLPLDVTQWTAADFKKVREGGLGQDVAGKLSEVKNLAASELIEDAYVANSRELITAAGNMTKAASNYLKDSFDTMKQQWLNPVGNNEDDKKAVRDKIWANANTILAGTGISPQELLNGTVKTDIFDTQVTRFNKAIARATNLQEKDISSQVITNQWSPQSLAKYQVAKQVAEGFYARRQSDNKAALDNMRADVFAGLDLSLEGTLDPEHLRKADKQEKMINSLANRDGLINIDAARNKYIQTAHTLYEDDASRYEGKTGREISGKTAIQKAAEDFDKNYEILLNKYTENMPNWKAAAASSDRGGALAVKNAMEFSVKGENKFSPSYMQMEKIASELPKSGQAVYFPVETQNISDINENIIKRDLASRFFEKFRVGDTKDFDFIYKLRNQPPYGAKQKISPQGAVLDVTLSDQTIRKLYPEFKKDDPLTPYKSFAVQVPQGESSTVDQFISKTTPNNVDIYMLQEGATLNQNLPNLGSYNITRQGSNIIFTGKFKAINPITQSEEDIEFEPQNLGAISAEKSMEVGNSLLEQAGIFRNNAKKELLSKQLQNARTTSAR